MFPYISIYVCVYVLSQAAMGAEKKELHERDKKNTVLQAEGGPGGRIRGPHPHCMLSDSLTCMADEDAVVVSLASHAGGPQAVRGDSASWFTAV